MDQNREPNRRRFLNWLESNVPAGKDRIAAARAGKVFYGIGVLLIVLWLGENHPVSPNTFVNLGYHTIAFLATLVLWGVLAFGGGAVLFRAVKNPPPWIVLGLVGIALFVAVYARFQIDEFLQMNGSASEVTIEEFSNGSSR